MPVDLADLAKIQEELDKAGYKSKPSSWHIRYLNELKAMYDKEGKEGKNPVFVWLAYDYARQLIKLNYDFVIPEWVFNYFDEAAKRLQELGPGKNTPRKICSALMMDTSGRGNTFTTARGVLTRFYAIQWVLSEKRLNPRRKNEDIFAEVAGELSTSEKIIEIITVKNWYYRLRKTCKP